MRKVVVLAVALVALVAWTIVSQAQQQAVYLKDGRKLVGEVTKTAAGYQIKTPAGTVVIGAADVVKVEDVQSPQQELKTRLAKADQNNPEELYNVAVWALDNGLLAEARDLLGQALKLRPDYENAKLQLTVVEARLKAATRSVTTGAKPPTEGPRDLVDPSMLVKDEDIYRIRLMELKESDNVLIDFRNNVVDRFVKSMRGTGPFAEPGGEREFRGLSNVRKARYILDNTDRDNIGIRDDIIVKSDPGILRDFKTRIWPIIARNCASASCHGGVKGAGGFKLFNLAIAQTDERIVYTNFYILQGWQARDGKEMVNRRDKENSLVLQYGLLDSLAKWPHPRRVDPPAFTSRDDRNYKIVEDWIAALRYPVPPPGYRVDYAIPGSTRATTQVTTAP